MYSLLGSIRAISNVSSSTAYCFLNIWHSAHFNSTHGLASFDVRSYKHQACSSRTPPRDIDINNVSLKTLLVLVHRRIFRPSHVHLLGGASVSRPHHCQPQRVAKNSLWAAAWATTKLFHVVEQMTGPGAFDFVVPVRPSRCSSTCTMHSGSFSGYSRQHRWQFCSVASSLPGSGNFVILVLDVISLPLCKAHTSASPESIQWYIFQSVVLRSCVTAPLQVKNTHLSNSRSNPLWLELVC